MHHNQLSTHVDKYPYKFFVEETYPESRIQDEIQECYELMNEHGNEPIIDSMTLSHHLITTFQLNVIGRIIHKNEDYDFSSKGMFGREDLNGPIREHYSIFGDENITLNAILTESNGWFSIDQKLKSLFIHDIETALSRVNACYIGGGDTYSVIANRDFFKSRDIRPFSEAIRNMPIVGVW